MGPLIHEAGVTLSRTSRKAGEQPNPISALSRILGKPTGTIHRWCRLGIPLHAADAMACRIGLHPSSVWTQDWWDACWEQDHLEEEARADWKTRKWLQNQGKPAVRARAELVVEYEKVEKARHLRVVA